MQNSFENLREIHSFRSKNEAENNESQNI